jgi:hypothetical protein
VQDDVSNVSASYDLTRGEVKFDLYASGDPGTAPVPEPSTFILLGIGLLGLGLCTRRHKQA